MMNFRQLRVFLAVCETGSLSAAAERLHLSQSVVSRHLSALEEVLGSALVDRLPRGVATTEAGDLLADYARRLFSVEGQARAALVELRNLQVGRLRVGASMTIGNYLLPHVLASYHRRYPGLDIELSVANTAITQHELEARHIDVGLTEGFVDDNTFQAHAFMSDQLVPVTGYDTQLAKIEHLTLAELVAHPCVMREPGSGTRAVAEQALAEHGLKLKQAMALGSSEAVKRAVIAGTGFTITSLHTVESELREGKLVRLRPSHFLLRRPLHLLQLRNRQPSPVVASFMRLIDGSIFEQTK